MHTRFKRVILVAPEKFPEPLIAEYTNVKHVSLVNSIFPSIYELNPDLIIFDHDFIGRDLEKILRRIQVNKFYDKMKIFCYKSEPDTKTDGFLSVLGVDRFIYKEDLATAQKSKTLFKTAHSIIDSSIMNLVTSVSN